MATARCGCALLLAAWTGPCRITSFLGPVRAASRRSCCVSVGFSRCRRVGRGQDGVPMGGSRSGRTTTSCRPLSASGSRGGSLALAASPVASLIVV